MVLQDDGTVIVPQGNRDVRAPWVKIGPSSHTEEEPPKSRSVVVVYLCVCEYVCVPYNIYFWYEVCSNCHE